MKAPEIMKRNMGLFFAALAGGLVAVGISKWTEDTVQPINYTFENQLQAPPVTGGQLTGFGGMAATPDFTAAAEGTVDGVVFVKTSYKANNGYYSYDPMRELLFGDGLQKHAPKQAMASGSGVIISADGYVVTNNHVIKNADKVEIALDNKQVYPATIIGTDPASDLALLKIEGENFPYVNYGNSDELKVGEWVLAVGNPFNLNSTVTAGIVSAKARNIGILQNRKSNLPAVESFIQTDAAVNPGNSGGALVNTRGELVGINTAIKSNTGSYAGYSFAVPVNIVRKVVDDLLEFGTVQRAFIGVSISEIDSRIADKLGLDELNGVYVTGLTTDGAAKKAGIQIGDVITAINGQPISDFPELQEQVSRYRPGNQVVVTVNREGDMENIPVTLKNQFGNTELVQKEGIEIASTLGATLTPVKLDEKEKLGIDHGMKIEKLGQGKLKSSGLSEGFIITEIDDKKITTQQDVVTSLDGKKGGVLIEGVYPNGKKAYYGFGM